MAEGILIESISKQSSEQIESFKKQIIEGIELTERWAGSMQKIHLPSQLREGYSQTETAVKKTKKAVSEHVKVIRANQRQLQKLLVTQTKAGKELVKRRIETQKLTRENRLEAKVTSSLTGAYEQLDAELSILSNEYRDLAVRKDRFNDLTAEEAKRMDFLEGEIQQYYRTLITVDSKMGRFTRNVGNYASAHNGLAFSFAQITREAPAFANSMQTGFMAISNNLPILVDEINKVRRANKLMVAEGKPVKSLFSQLAGAALSWNTLISVGVTLMTVYGGKLIEMAFGMSKAEKATEEANKKIKEQNDQIRENIKLRRQQLGQTTRFIDAQTDSLRKALVGSGGEEQGLILIEIAERLRDLGVEGADAVKDQNIAQMDRVVIANNLLEVERLRADLDEERLRLSEATKVIEETEKAFAEGRISAEAMRNKLLVEGNLSITETVRIQKRIQQLLQANESIEAKIVELKDKDNEKRKKQVELLKDYLKHLESLTQWYTKVMPDILAKEAARLLQGTGRTEALEAEAKALNTVAALNEQRQRQLDKEMEIIKGAFVDLGVTFGLQQETISNLFDSIRFGFTDAGEAAEQFSALFVDSLRVMTNAENERINRRIEQLGIERDVAMQFAGDSASAREAVERRYQQQVTQMRQKQAENNKQQAIFESLINTAAAVVKTFADLGFPAGLPAATIVASLGAIKTAFIANQKVPSFETGVRNFEGGVARINERRQEVVTTPDGRVLRPRGQNIFVDLPPGSNVYASEGEFRRELNGILSDQGINPIGGVANKRIPSFVSVGGSSISEAGMKRVLSETLGKMQKSVLNLDKDGFSTYNVKQLQRTNNLNNRVNKTGIDV